MNLTLVKASTEDIPTIYNLAKTIWHDHYIPIIGAEQVEYMLANMYSSASLTEQMNIKQQPFYLIYLANNPVGFISVSGAKDMFIHKFYINTSTQRKGLGTEVFLKLIELYPDATTYSLTVNRQNYKAINFYFKLGFTIERVEDFDIGEGYWMNDFIMKWARG